MHGRGLFLLCGAVIRSTQSLPACAARSYGEPSRHAMPAPFAGGDLEEPGVMEAALNARAPSKELVFLSVGDTRDHRREIKDPVRAPRCHPPARLLLSRHRATAPPRHRVECAALCATASGASTAR